jgi:hypothetical protein
MQKLELVQDTEEVALLESISVEACQPDVVAPAFVAATGKARRPASSAARRRNALLPDRPRTGCGRDTAGGIRAHDPR